MAQMKPPSFSLICLAIAAFLCPIAGGHVALEKSALEPGPLSTLLAAVWSFDAPSLSHMLLGLLIALAQAVAFVRRQVVQLPTTRILAPLLGFVVMLVLSTVLSSFKMQSLANLTEWLIYACAFLTVVACTGRGIGPRLLLTAVFAGCVVAALRGLVVDAQMAGRIFGGWQHPNALAGMLLVGLLLGFGLVMTAERLEAVAIGAGITLITVALALTESKGGYLAAAAGMLTFAIVLIAPNRRHLLVFLAMIVVSAGLYISGARGLVLLGGFLVTVVAGLSFVYVSVGRRVLNVVVPLGFTAFIIVVMALKGPATTPGGPPVARPFERVVAPAASSDQSVRYRINLWKSAWQLSLANPAGYGLNTFQYHSARPGLVSSGTVYAHQSFLQLWSEASPLSVAFLLVFVGTVLREVTRGLSKAPPELRLLRAAVFAALIGATAQSLVESQLYIMGFGLVYFMLCGIALQLSYDGAAPELVPREAKWVLMSGTALVAIMVIYFGVTGTVKARVNGDLMLGDIQAAGRGTDELLTLASNDGQVHFLASGQAAVAGNTIPVDADTAVSELRRAIRLHPTPRYHRSLARLLHHLERSDEALKELDKALQWDPNNWDAMDQKLTIQKEMGDTQGAQKTARQIVVMEDSPAFKVRALPEIVPIEIYDAHAYLATLESDLSRKAGHLQKAVDGYEVYTFFSPHNISSGVLAPQVALERANHGAELAEQLAALYRQLGDKEKAKAAEHFQGEFVKRAEALPK